ncbi:tRNA-queuosine alpha-mannosyltransferase domain-containing protein [Amphritea sp.]|uniref:tRNA-queuosine alpha-mannosyltransferase domain-containing protein n=1 Tax=Amphritea sp. TaxID=1872502 RepID=UPI003A9435D0
MKILLLSAYDAASHRYWHQGVMENLSQHQWTLLTLPPRYFSWRIRGNSLSWAMNERETLEQPYDLVIATSMTDLSALRGFVPHLASIPTLVYFHENQFAYPESGREYGNVEPKILNIYTALAADHICFNTFYNRNTFLNGCRALLKKLPDQVPAGVVEQLEERSSVLQVPLPSSAYQPHNPQCGAVRLIWNHRWEFDKGPDRLLRAVEGLCDAGVDFRLDVVGQQFRRVPPVFEELKTLLAERAGHWGFVESVAEYRLLLQQADIVLSTALHDYQGIAVLEGAAAGALPLVPNRLAYPELFPQECCYQSGDAESQALVSAVINYADAKQQGHPPAAPDISGLSWGNMAQQYERLLQDVANSSISYTR